MSYAPQSPGPTPYGNPRQPKKRKIRIFTWIILAINVLFLVWAIAAGVSGSGNASNCGTLDQQTCNDAAHAGTAIGIGLLIFLWAAVDVILGIIWLVTRKREPQVVYVQQQAGPGGGWYPDPQNPRGSLRWWDGQRFTEHTSPRQ